MKLFARPAVRVTVALVAVVGMLVLVVGPVFAHSNLKSVSPADGSVLDTPPDEVVLTFTANVLPDFTQVAVACDGQEVSGLPSATTRDNTVTQPVGAAATGECVVTFRIVSADSHPISGQSRFTVNAPAATTPAASATPTASAPPASTAPTPSVSPSAPTTSETPSTTPTTAPASPASTSSTWSSTALLVLLAAALLGLFAWLAKGRRPGR